MNLLLFVVILTVALLFLSSTLTVLLMLGEEYERQAWLHDTQSTIHLYTSNESCTANNGKHILNCGTCGKCSNRHDIRRYQETANTLTGIMTTCSIQPFFLHLGSSNYMYNCLRGKSQLSDECANCWVENAICNKQYCLTTCTKRRLFPYLPPWSNNWKRRNSNHPLLDPCDACDEQFCGPKFLNCAGANRRRAGVVSDIDRDMGKEICNRVDWDYILSGNDDVNTGSSSTSKEEEIVPVVKGEAIQSTTEQAEEEL